MTNQVLNYEVAEVLLDIERDYRMRRVVTTLQPNAAHDPSEYNRLTHIIQSLQTAAWVAGASTLVLEGQLKTAAEIRPVLLGVLAEMQRNVTYENQNEIARRMGLITNFLPAFK